MIDSKVFWENSFIKFSECVDGEIPFKSIFDDEFQIIKEFTDSLKSNDKVLDFGSGIGRNSFPMAQKGYSVDICDISDEAIRFCLEYSKKNSIKVKSILYKENKLEVEDNKYDAIVVWSVLDYVTSIAATQIIEEFKRILKVNGTLLICFDPLKDELEIKDEFEILEDGTFLYKSGETDGMLYRKYKNSDITKLFDSNWELSSFPEVNEKEPRVAIFKKR
jgi:ubiquinone/menaquinone biosynthesis C-methylase UbiE